MLAARAFPCWTEIDQQTPGWAKISPNRREIGPAAPIGTASFGPYNARTLGNQFPFKNLLHAEQVIFMLLKRFYALRSVILLAVFASALPTLAAEKYGNSLDWVPANVAFYSSSMRMKEQIDIVGASKAWQKFRAIPFVADVWSKADAQINDPNGPAAIGLQFMELPENQQLLQMLGDMFSNEIAVYGGPKVADCLKLFQLINAAQQQEAFKAARAAKEGDAAPVDQAHAVLTALQAHKELLKTPDFVVAFRLTDKQAAQTQLKRLEVITKMALRQTPIADRFKREKIGDAEYLTISLDGSLVPWDQVPWDRYEETEGEFKSLRESLEKMTLVISLGVHGNDLIFSIDESTAHLAKLGQGPVLGDAKEFAPLAKYRDRKLVGLAYMSEAFAKSVQMKASDLDQVVKQIDGMLDAAGIDDDKLKERISSDVTKLSGDIKGMIPTPGAVMGFSFLTPTGFEGYSYNWTENKTLDGGRPLELANHVGGNPILAIVARGKYDPASYDVLVKWLKVGYGYIGEFALPQMNEEERQKAKLAMEIAEPLLARADKATRDHLVPSLKDGQSGLVLDAQIASKQWHNEMPNSKQALPMLELGFVLGISDAKEFRAAMAEYRSIAADLIKKVREKDPSAVPPELDVPEPEKETIPAGTVYKYSLPADAGLDSQIAPSVGVGEHVAVFATSPKLAARVLAETPMRWQGLSSGESGKPCATLISFNWANMVDAMTPWVEFAIRMHGPGAEGADAESDPEQIAAILSQVRTGLEILKCWKSVEGVTTIENGVTVGHTITTFKDVD